jgi:chaperonin GroEL
VVLNRVKEGKDDFGFNAQTEKYENLIAAGVIDPTKVTRIALENAASVSGLLLTTEATIVEKPEKEKPMPPMPHGGGMGDMY